MTNQRKEPTLSSGSKDDLTERRRPKRPAASPQRATTSPSQTSSGSGFIWFVFLIALAAAGAAGYSFWILQQSQQLITTQADRIASLEKKLELSGDSANQSLEGVSIRIGELTQENKSLAEKVKVSESEIRKLWDTRNVNKKGIETNQQAIASLQGQKKATDDLSSNVEKVKKDIASANKNVSEVTQALSSLDEKVNTLTPLGEDIEQLTAKLENAEQINSEQELLLESLRERLAQQSEQQKQLASQQQGASSASLDALDQRIQQNEEAIESYEAFRRTVNRELLQLKQ